MRTSIRLLAVAPLLWATAVTGQERGIPATRYEILASGPATGETPRSYSAVQIRYIGTLVDGSVFRNTIGSGDGTEIYPLRLLIPGVQSALLLMRRGDRWRVTVPPEQAYGLRDHVMAGKTLIFDLELVDFVDVPPPASPTLPALPGR